MKRRAIVVLLILSLAGGTVCAGGCALGNFMINGFGNPIANMALSFVVRLILDPLWPNHDTTTDPNTDVA
jgi:hypothetical protein